MRPTVRVALLGFLPEEREQLQSALTPEMSGSPERSLYKVCEDLASSSLAVVNADDEIAVGEVLRQRRLASTVMLGLTAWPRAGAQMGWPLDRERLCATLDSLCASSPPVSDAVRRVQDELLRLGGSRFARPAGAGAATQAPVLPLTQDAARTSKVAVRSLALVVDEGELLLRRLGTLLAGQAVDWQLARSAPEAMECVQTLRPRWVFVATGLDSIDGYHTCRMLRHGSRPQEQRPQVLLVLQHDGAVERLRAQLAGADAVLAQPVQQPALMQAWHSVDAQQADLDNAACSPPSHAAVS